MIRSSALALTLSKMVLLAVPLSLLLCYLNNDWAGISFAIYLSLAIPFAAFSIVLFSKVRNIISERKFEEELMESFYSITYYRSKGMPLARIIEKIAEESDSRDVRVVLRLISQQMRLGKDFGAAVASIGTEKGIPILDQVQCNYGSADYGSIKRIIDTYERSLEERKSRVDETIQRYATVNMFLSTVLPSFVIFSLMGEMILSQRSGSMLVFSVAMVIMLPFAYLIGNVVLNRRLYD